MFTIFNKNEKRYLSDISEISSAISEVLIYQLHDDHDNFSASDMIYLGLVGASLAQATLRFKMPEGLTDKEMGSRMEMLRKLRVNCAFDLLKFYHNEIQKISPLSKEGKDMLNTWCELQRDLSTIYCDVMSNDGDRLPLLRIVNDSLQNIQLHWTEDGVSRLMNAVSKIKWA